MLLQELRILDVTLQDGMRAVWMGLVEDGLSDLQGAARLSQVAGMENQRGLDRTSFEDGVQKSSRPYSAVLL